MTKRIPPCPILKRGWLVIPLAGVLGVLAGSVSGGMSSFLNDLAPTVIGSGVSLLVSVPMGLLAAANQYSTGRRRKTARVILGFACIVLFLLLFIPLFSLRHI